jgi:SAM-dependent methyltransferase
MGRVFGWFMERLNAEAYRWTIKQLKPVKPKSYLEIGFGTGKLLKLAMKKLKLAKICGVDPSELMVETAQKKLNGYKRKLHIDVQRGDDKTVPFRGPFDAIAAIHSFQFWLHPATSLTHLRSLLAPNGRFVLVLRRHDGKKPPKWLPNPISKGGDEISAACKAAEGAGFSILTLQKISKSSYGIVLGCG